MATNAYRADGGLSRVDWGAIWGGVFCFMSIWAVFETLGLAIFAGSANPASAKPILGMSVGIVIWSIILTIIAMYVAGRETGRLAGVSTRHDGLVHGLMMFGLSIVALVVLVSLGSAVLNGGQSAAGSAHNPYVFTMLADLGWGGFVALFLGWLAAMFGASSGVSHKAEGNVQDIRPAA